MALLAASVLFFFALYHSSSAAINWNGNNWAMGCDFVGKDMSNRRISSEQCGGECAKTGGCTHFTWTQFNGGTCWMKTGGASKSDAIESQDQSMVCGVITSSPSGGLITASPSSGSPGITTRYWDCCKSSCSWGGKVQGSSAYVKSCRKDGASVFDNSNAQSGCNGGDAFVCNNQKPWAVNDQLAYGFAAATLPGLSEQQLCCTCYKLDFVGDLSGKSMIVQITNSGSDVKLGQFDLQIPGGGVGIFNGCQPQWGAPSNGWGQRYGGVGSANECNQLPAQIRDGCFFRFNWMKGSSNPAMTYSKVNCPRELTSITGCSA